MHTSVKSENDTGELRPMKEKYPKGYQAHEKRYVFPHFEARSAKLRR